MYLTINVIIDLAFLHCVLYSKRNIEPFSKHSLIYPKFADCCELGGIILLFVRLSTFFVLQQVDEPRKNSDTILF